MKLKKTLVVAFTALALAGAATGGAYADDGDKFVQNNELLNCLDVEVIAVPVLSPAFQDCSDNEEETEIHVTPNHHNNH
ncbi:MAG TPA: hypothetical protein DEQ61_11980 [Streptomyces sp.]|nr:hypothetical protein [Streptomyces sp.]